MRVGAMLIDIDGVLTVSWRPPLLCYGGCARPECRWPW
jgi:hypothetical protein